MAGQPEGLERNSPRQRRGLWDGNAPPFPPFSPERARRSEVPLAPFQGLQRKQNTAPNASRQRLPPPMAGAVTSQPFRLNGHTGQGRWRQESFNSCAADRCSPGGTQRLPIQSADLSAARCCRQLGARNAECGVTKATANGRESGIGNGQRPGNKPPDRGAMNRPHAMPRVGPRLVARGTPLRPRTFTDIPLTSFIGGLNVSSCAASDERWPQAGRIRRRQRKPG